MDMDYYAGNYETRYSYEEFQACIYMQSWAVRCRLNVHIATNENIFSRIYSLSDFAGGTVYLDYPKRQPSTDVVAIHLGTIDNDYARAVVLIAEKVDGSTYRRIGLYVTDSVQLARTDGVRGFLDTTRPEGGWEIMCLELF